LVSIASANKGFQADICVEHTLLVTDDGVEILTARLPDSPGGPAVETNGTNGVSEAKG